MKLHSLNKYHYCHLYTVFEASVNEAWDAVSFFLIGSNKLSGCKLKILAFQTTNSCLYTAWLTWINIFLKLPSKCWWLWVCVCVRACLHVWMHDLFWLHSRCLCSLCQYFVWICSHTTDPHRFVAACDRSGLLSSLHWFFKSLLWMSAVLTV